MKKAKKKKIQFNKVTNLAYQIILNAQNTLFIQNMTVIKIY